MITFPSSCYLKVQQPLKATQKSGSYTPLTVRPATQAQLHCLSRLPTASHYYLLPPTTAYCLPPLPASSPLAVTHPRRHPAASGGSTQNIPHFGTFRVQSLQEGLAIAENATSELKKIFKKNEKIVNAVAERWEDDQALHEEIRKLRAAKDGIWEHINQDREIYATTISGL